MISRLKEGCLNCLFFILMIPCYCCMIIGILLAPSGYSSGQEAATEILSYQFEGELTEIEFFDNPPIAIFPGGASEWVTWTVLELDEDQAIEFEQAISTRSEWQAMPLPDELLVNGENWLQPDSITGARERLPIRSENGCYLFSGDLEAGSFTIAIYDSETRWLYVNCKDQ
jgi:hypothetical protein